MDGSVRVSAAGAEIMCFREALEELEGAEAVRRATARLSPAARTALDELTPMCWAPTELLTELADAVARGTHENRDVVLERTAREGLTRTLRLFFRAFLNGHTDEALLARAPIIFSRLRDTGHVEARLRGARDAELRLTGWPSVDPRQMKLVAIGFEALFALAGRRSPLCHWDATDDGALFRLTWS
jgi:hypothetical protein